MKKVTIKEVAAELGLSRNTVAKALNNSNTVSFETRYFVIKKAYEMGYAKLSAELINEYKIKDRLEETKTVVVFARRELSTFWNRIIMGISDELNQNNCRLLLHFISDEEEREHILPVGTQKDIDGIIILNVFQRSYLELILKKDIPVVFLDGPKDIFELSGMGDIMIFEGNNSTKKLTEHLIAQGMKRIGFIGDITYCRSIWDRYEGYLSALAEHGMEAEEEFLIIKHVNYKYYRQEEVTNALENLRNLPEAFVCANDQIAKDAMLWMKKKGIKVPNDVAITGFDDKEEVGLLSPSLTTVHIGNQRMGRRLVQQLVWRMKHMELPGEILFVNTEVIIRESSVRK